MYCLLYLVISITFDYLNILYNMPYHFIYVLKNIELYDLKYLILYILFTTEGGDTQNIHIHVTHHNFPSCSKLFINKNVFV